MGRDGITGNWQIGKSKCPSIQSPYLSEGISYKALLTEFRIPYSKASDPEKE